MKLKFNKTEDQARNLMVDDWIKFGKIHYRIVVIHRDATQTNIFLHADSSANMFSMLNFCIPNDEIVMRYNQK